MHANVEFLIREYIAGWRTHDKARVGAVVAYSCTVIESDGVAYAGRDEILQWIDRWVVSGSRVVEWEITSLVAVEASACAEWQFTCVCGGKLTSFPGASVFQVCEGRIVSVVEYRRAGKPNLPSEPTRSASDSS